MSPALAPALALLSPAAEPPRRAQLSDLAPQFALTLSLALHECQSVGLRFSLYEGLRTDERQRWLYAQGRTRSGSIVTNAASALYSWHGYALAGDVVWFENGQWSWPSESSSVWQKLLDICKKYDLTTGLAWPSFQDRPHVQPANLKRGPSDYARQLFAEGGMKKVWQVTGHDVLTDAQLLQLKACL